MLDGVRLEEVVRLELHAARLERYRVLAWPYLGFGLFEHRDAVLDDEIQVGVYLRQLQTEPACVQA